MFGFAKKLVSSIESQLSTDLSGTSSQHLNVDESRQALRVVSVKNDSIASHHGFESWFDFIVALNGTDIRAYLEINTETGHVGYGNLLNFIKHEVEVSKTEFISFTVLSSKGSIIRDVKISSTEIAEEINKSNFQNSLEEINLMNDDAQSPVSSWIPKLGLSFQLTPISTGYFTWHVLHVHPNSPAYLAGIMPGEYIIQSQDGLLATGGEGLLAKVLKSQFSKFGNGCEVVLYVYNYDYDCIRPVRVILKDGSLWGGKGILGCDIGYGLLHRIPEVIGKFEKSSNQSLNETSFSNDTVVEQPVITQPPQFLPLKVSAPSFASNESTVGETVDEASHAIVSNPHRKRHGKQDNVDLNAYFDEQTKISKEADTGNTATTTHSVSVPPPPLSKK